MIRTRTARPFAALAVAALLLAGCGSSGGSDASSSDATTTTAAKGDATTTTGADSSAAPITVLVGNDDGYGADGIDALVQALADLPGVTVDVVAPKTNQSGTGGKVSDSQPPVAKVTTKGGHPRPRWTGTRPTPCCRPSGRWT